MQALRKKRVKRKKIKKGENPNDEKIYAWRTCT
jgi:hypothetical protein